MTITSLLIANRGEIAIRIARAAAELGIRTVALFAEDDAASLHVCKTDDAIGLRGSGAASYLDGEQIIAAALAAGCDAIHPGYGFLSENAGFAQRCIDADLVFVGPPPAVLALFGNKLQAKALAERHQIPVAGGPSGAASVDEIHAFYSSLGSDAAIMIKAVAGGGGRGMRAVHEAAQIDEAYLRCRSEAGAAFGNDAVYAERLLTNARHIEVQIIGDGRGGVSHLWDRECSLQRRHQKLVEIAPSPTLLPALRDRIIDAALCLARAVQYQSLGTFEFLLDGDDVDENASYIFMEANPRLQVEHTVTEEVTGVDLVKAQLQLASGASLAELGLTQDDIRQPVGFAMQLRVNMETMQADGSVIPAGGRLDAFEPPTGPGVRVDTAGYAGYVTSTHYDSLLAKVIVHSTSPRYADTVARAYRALSECRIEGVATNIAVLQNLLGNDAVIANRVHIGFIETHLAQLLAPQRDVHRKRYFDTPPISARPSRSMIVPDESNGAVAVGAPMQGSVVSIDVQTGDAVHAGQQLGVMEAMKMEHVITASASGVIRKIVVAKGDVVFAGDALLYIALTEIAASAVTQAAAIDLDLIRPDLAEVRMRHDIGLDAFRADAVARRRKTGQRTARENIADLCDADSFIEYGALAIAGQRTRRPIDELIRISPADGLVSGIGAVNGTLFDEHHARCMILAYDYTVFAGTQGAMNHKKTDRMLQLAQDWKVPVIFFTEGGGGRPGDVDAQLVAGLDCTSFHKYAGLSGLVPRVGIVSGRCFAGNAAFLGCSDVIIATENATVGMGGPAMIEGGGLGVFSPEEVGPVALQSRNGVIDIVVTDEAEAVRAARRYLSYFQGRLPEFACADQRALRHLVPENRLRVYDIRTVIETLADTGSVLELRRHFGIGIVTAFVRIEGRPMGLMANNPAHLGGAIDADAADKASRFIQLCDAFDIPIVSLCDTPGFMVGPAAEQTAMVRHVSRMFVTAASITVPFFTVVLRKGYGLGAQAMAGGSFHAPMFTIAWPSAEFGAMGIEGAVRLGYRKELEAVADPGQRKQLFDEMVAAAYEKGKAINMASFLEIDEVIDPIDTRTWLVRGLRSSPAPGPRSGKKRTFVDTW